MAWTPEAPSVHTPTRRTPMARSPRPYQLHARREIVTVETVSRPVTNYAERDTAETEAELWRRAGFEVAVVDTSAGETPPWSPDPDDPGSVAAEEAETDARPIEPGVKVSTESQDAAGSPAFPG